MRSHVPERIFAKLKKCRLVLLIICITQSVDFRYGIISCIPRLLNTFWIEHCIGINKRQKTHYTHTKYTILVLNV